MKPELVKNIDLSKISYTDIKAGKAGVGSKVFNILYKGKPIALQLPKMTIPFPATDYNGDKKFKVNFSFDINSDPEHKKAFDKLKELDEKLVNDACKNSKEWFDSKRTADGIRDGFQSQLRESDKYDPLLKCKLINDNDNGFRTVFIDQNNEAVSVTQDDISTQIPQRSTGTAIIECAGVWIVQKTLTLTWRVVKMKYEKAEKGKYEILEDEEDENYEVIHEDNEIVEDTDEEENPEETPKEAEKTEVAEEPTNTDTTDTTDNTDTKPENSAINTNTKRKRGTKKSVEATK